MKNKTICFAKIACLIACTLIVAGVGIRSCSKVPAGYVGVKVYLLGGEKGVDSEVVGVGRYWLGINEELFLFPTFQQTAVWTKDKTQDSPTDQSFTFQTREGLSVNADMSISYTINPDKVAVLFQRYRKGVEEITHVYLRNVVRDMLVQSASTQTVESIYGEGKSALIHELKQKVTEKMAPVGIVIDYVSFVGDLRLPRNVINAINLKISATQKAQQRENELREAKAEAEKRIAAAEGNAKAKIAEAEGEAKSLLLRAEAQAKANDILARSLTSELLHYNTIQSWDGKLPQVNGGAMPLLQLPVSTLKEN